MSSVEKPIIEAARYAYDVGLSRVDGQGYQGEDLRDVPVLSIDSVLELGPPEDLAFVSFYQRAVVAVRNPSLENIETLEGVRKRRLAEQYVVAWDSQNRIPIFSTAATILEAGQLTPHMRRWLSCVADNPQRSAYELQAFEGLFGRSLR